MNVFIISPVRNISDVALTWLYAYTRTLESKGCQVHLPHRDTDQSASSLDICFQNESAIERSDEVHILYWDASQGVHFDLGVAFAKRKKIVTAEELTSSTGKSFQNLIKEYQLWHEQQAAGGVAV